MPDFEAAKGGGIRKGRFGVLLYMSAQLALQNRFEKRGDFVFGARGLKFNPAVPEIPDRPCKIETFGDLPH
jgi:hypothetical protein